MSKEFKNIDDLFKSTIGTGAAKAPTSVKQGVLSAIGGGNWWLVGAALLFVTAIGAVATTFNMPVKTIATEQGIETSHKINNPESAINTNTQTNNNIHIAKADKNKTALSDTKNNLNNDPQQLKQLSEQVEPPQNNSAVANNSTANRQTKNEQKAVRRATNSQPLQLTKPREKMLTIGSSKTITNKPLEQVATQSEDSKQKTDSLIIDHKKENKPLIDINLAVNSSEETNNIQKSTSSSILTTKKSIQEGHIDPHTPPIQSIELNAKDNADTIGKFERAGKQKDEALAIIPSATAIQDSMPTLELKIAKKLDKGFTADSSKQAVKIEEKPNSDRGYWMISANVGSNINNTNYGSTEFGQSLNKFHEENLGFQGQILGQYTTASNFVTTLGIGLENQSYNTTFLTTSTSYDVEVNSIFSHVIFNSTTMTNDSIFIEQFDSTATTDLTNHFGFAQNQYLQIPVRLGYQIEKNKWILGFDLGVQVNYLLKAKGSYLLNNEVFNQEELTILKSTTLNYSVGGNIQYNFINNIYLQGQMRFSPAVQNYYQNSYGKRAINAFTIGCGVGLKF